MKKVIEFEKQGKIINKKMNKKKFYTIIAIGIILVLILINTIAYNVSRNFRNFMDKYIFFKNITEENVPIIEIDYDSNTNIIPYGKYICILAENTLSEYNSLGKKEKDVKLEISNPIYDVENKYMVIGQKDGQKLYLVVEDHVVWEKDIDGNLNKVTVNKNGYVSAIITGTTYKSVIVTYDAKGNELFKSYLSGTIAVDACISPDNSELAYAEVNSAGTVIQSNIKIIAINEAKEKNTEPKYTYNAQPNSLILRIKYQNRNQLICMYDDGIHKFESGVDVEILSLNDKETNNTFADIELTGHIYRTIEQSTGLFSANTILEMRNVSNDRKSNYTIEDVAKNVISHDNIVAVNLGNEVDFIDTNAWLVKRYLSTQGIEDITICDGLAGIIYRDKIELVNL